MRSPQLMCSPQLMRSPQFMRSPLLMCSPQLMRSLQRMRSLQFVNRLHRSLRLATRALLVRRRKPLEVKNRLVTGIDCNASPSGAQRIRKSIDCLILARVHSVGSRHFLSGGTRR